MTARRRPLAAAVVLTAACGARPTATPRGPSVAATTETAASKSEDPATCADPKLPLGSYAFVPADARLAASVRLDHPQIERALSHLAALEPPHPLPIVVATALSHLQTQVDLLRPVLQRAGFNPAELLLLATNDGDQAWLWRSTCDLAIARASVERAWSVRLRQTAGGLVGSPDAQAPDSFAFDVLFLPGELFALVPAGKASRVRLWLDGVERGPSPAGDDPAPGARLERMQPAAVRAVMTGTGLLPSDVETSARPPKQLRATATGLEIDGTAWHPTP